MSRHLRSFLILIVGILALAASARADVKLPAIIGDNMVLQRGMAVPIWGWADPGEEVRVGASWLSKGASTLAEKDGKWMLKIDVPNVRNLAKAGPHTMVVMGKTSKTFIYNILLGEVWVGSGQSNMEMSVKGCINASQEIAGATFPSIRLFTVKKAVATTPQDDCTGQWVECSPETVGNFSAALYFFGRDIHRNLGLPTGLIHTSWGGTPAEAWTARPVMQKDPALAGILENWQKRIDGYPAAKAGFPDVLAKWQKDSDDARAANKPVPRRPNAPEEPDKSPWGPGQLYNAMLNPIMPYGIAGAIWYQGESNAGRAMEYRKLFPAMITNWRQAWGQGDFPFFFVQLANFYANRVPGDTKPEVEPVPPLPYPRAAGDSGWAELREAQTMTLSLPKTGMAVIIDVGDVWDIHPKNKQTVGHRLALAAENVAYDQSVEQYGPMYKSMSVEGMAVRVRCTHARGGLVAKNGKDIRGFALAGEDKVWHWAQAKVDGSEVVVSCSSVPKPKAVRYNWSDSPVGNLYNNQGLPMCPFRSDDWVQSAK